MPLEPGSGGLRQNHALTGSLFSDIRLELGLEQRQDEVLMGWREEPNWGIGVFDFLTGDRARGGFR